jgi:hypothetical protein
MEGDPHLLLEGLALADWCPDGDHLHSRRI